MIKTILFDLDGTLLPMDNDDFAYNYFLWIRKCFVKLGYDDDLAKKALFLGIENMINNDGNMTNEERFFLTCKNILNEDVFSKIDLITKFYEESYDQLKSCCGYQEKANYLIKSLKEKGYQLILATNPFFPKIATEKRIEWAGLDKDDFLLVTTYENEVFCKPNLKYYQSILQRYDLKAEECLMIGNNIDEDIIANQLGMNVFLLTDNLINKNNVDYSSFPHGDFTSLLEYLLK